jgi:hypothetical protein
MVLQTCEDSLISDPVSSSETCLRSAVGGNEVIGIKVEEEEHPEAISFPTIKTEPEVSFIPL